MSVIYDQEQSGWNYCNKQQGQSGTQGVLICRELWQWLIEHGVSRSKIEMNLIRSFLNFTTKKSKVYIQKGQPPPPKSLSFAHFPALSLSHIQHQGKQKTLNVSSSPSLKRLKTIYLSNQTLRRREFPCILRIVRISWHWYLDTRSVIMAPLLDWECIESSNKWSPALALAHIRSTLSMDSPGGYSVSPQMYK